MFNDFVINWINQQIDKSRFTDTSRVCCSKDLYGQYVDIDYTYIPGTDMVEDSTLIFAEIADNGSPTEKTWEDLLKDAKHLSELLNLPLIVKE